MELMASVEALKWVCDSVPWSDVTRVLVVTDSLYVADNVMRAQGWKKMGWRNAHGEWKFNSDLWDKLLKLRAKTARLGLRVDFVWQKGRRRNWERRPTTRPKQPHSAGASTLILGTSRAVSAGQW
jgi:ribonuclease HI